MAEMRRNVIMSHGRMHDAKGLKGTYRKGTTAPAHVAAAIPTATNATQPDAQQAMPGQQGTSAPRTPMRIDAEGDPILPGGNRSGGPSTSRPQLVDVDGAVTVRSSSGQVPAQDPTPVEPPETTAPTVVASTRVARAEAPSTESGEGADVGDQVPLPLSKRKLQRASHSTLTTWCGMLGIDPESALDPDDAEATVTRPLMQGLIGERLGFNV